MNKNAIRWFFVLTVLTVFTLTGLAQDQDDDGITTKSKTRVSCIPSLDPGRFSVSAKTQTVRTVVRMPHRNCEFRLKGGNSWVTPATLSGKSGDTVRFTVTTNTSKRKRLAAFLITGYYNGIKSFGSPSVKIEQAAGGVTTHDDDPDN
jgi:hypothetical protein